MPSKYYYLISSLPRLEFDQTPPITKEMFLAECKKWLSRFHLEKLIRTDINDLDIQPKDPQIIKEWKSFDLALRTELAQIRKAKKESLQEKIPASFKDIFDEPTPLLMEKRLQEKKWLFIEEKEFGHHFDINFLMLYFLKLQILERLTIFEEEKGKSVFENLCEASYA